MSNFFENLSNKIYDEKINKLNKDSQDCIGNLLNPLKEKLQEFDKMVKDSFGAQSKEQYSLKSEIERIMLANDTIKTQTENLTKALKGESKTQGTWGEMILEKILEDSGLRKDHEYTIQGLNMGLRHPEEGGLLKPDVIVNLPEGKHIIIDSKVTLTNYEQYFASSSDGERSENIKQFLSSVKKHITDLEGKRYQDIEKLNSPDFILVFMPIEGAYAFAVENEPGLIKFAWDKRIVIVCPATLFATLRTIGFIWRLELQNLNSTKIAERGGALYDKVSAFVEDMQKLGKYLDNATQAYSDTMKKLSEGKGNILRQAENLKKLGSSCSKKIPKELIGDDEDENSGISGNGT